MELNLKRGLAIFAAFGFTWVAGVFGVHPVKSQGVSSPLRPGELIANPGAYLNHSVDLEILEPLDGPATAAALASIEYGEYRIRIPDGTGNEISLVPSSFQAKDPNRFKRKFDRVLFSPLRVRGEFLRDEEMTEAMHRPYYVIVVASTQPLVPGPAEKIASPEQLRADPARWDRKRIVYEGVYRSAFEVSALDGVIWLSTRPDAVVVGQPAAPPGTGRSDRVRATGTLFAKPGAHYGHMGGYTFELQADKLEYLGPISPSKD